ncbi:MAG: hypothetical protein ACK5B9_13930 [Flavobacteriia bacterium]|jgi:hypothetical protein
MTEKEARVFLNLSADFDEDEIVEAQENLLFELKQFFLTRVPLRKLFQSRLEKLIKLEETFSVYKIEMQKFKKIAMNFNFESDDILLVYNSYQAENKRLKSLISQSYIPSEVSFYVEQLIYLEKKYAQKWFSDSNLDENIIVSKEADAMELLESIKNYEGKSFSALKKNENSPSETLLNEMKRLSLLAHKY